MQKFKLFGHFKRLKAPTMPQNSLLDEGLPGSIYTSGETRCPMCKKIVERKNMRRWFSDGNDLKKGCKWCYLKDRSSYLKQKEIESDDIL